MVSSNGFIVLWEPRSFAERHVGVSEHDGSVEPEVIIVRWLATPHLEVRGETGVDFVGFAGEHSK